MAITKSAKAKQTSLSLETVFNELNGINKLSKTDFAKILNSSKQNISRRMGYNGYLLANEVTLIMKYLAEDGSTDNDIYKELFKYSEEEKSNHQIKEFQENNIDDDFVDLNVRGDVSLSCGYGIAVYNDNVTGKCKVSRSELRRYGASIPNTEIVYAQGDSMSPEIESGDALLVDTSQTEIINGIVYAFNYDGQPMCKRLQKIGNEIKAISKNPLYDSFTIDYNSQFNIVGRVVGLMRPIL